MSHIFNKVLIIGVGLIGSSIARALKKYNLADQVVGCDISSKVKNTCKELKILGPQYPFKRYGKSGQKISSQLPKIGEIADDICVIRSMYTEQINHDTAHTFMNFVNASSIFFIFRTQKLPKRKRIPNIGTRYLF